MFKSSAFKLSLLASIVAVGASGALVISLSGAPAAAASPTR